MVIGRAISVVGVLPALITWSMNPISILHLSKGETRGGCCHSVRAEHTAASSVSTIEAIGAIGNRALGIR